MVELSKSIMHIGYDRIEYVIVVWASCVVITHRCKCIIRGGIVVQFWGHRYGADGVAANIGDCEQIASEAYCHQNDCFPSGQIRIIIHIQLASRFFVVPPCCRTAFHV